MLELKIIKKYKNHNYLSHNFIKIKVKTDMIFSKKNITSLRFSINNQTNLNQPEFFKKILKKVQTNLSWPELT